MAKPRFSSILISTICLILLTFWSCGPVNEESNSDQKKEIGYFSEGGPNLAYLGVRDQVKARLKSPSTAEFPNVLVREKENHVRSLGNSRYQISSYVDAQNSFGARVRIPFTAEVAYQGDSKWRILSLELLE